MLGVLHEWLAGDHLLSDTLCLCEKKKATLRNTQRTLRLGVKIKLGTGTRVREENVKVLTPDAPGTHPQPLPKGGETGQSK
jgi:hypothetical protein